MRYIYDNASKQHYFASGKSVFLETTDPQGNHVSEEEISEHDNEREAKREADRHEANEQIVVELGHIEVPQCGTFIAPTGSEYELRIFDPSRDISLRLCNHCMVCDLHGAECRECGELIDDNDSAKAQWCMILKCKADERSDGLNVYFAEVSQ